MRIVAGVAGLAVLLVAVQASWFVLVFVGYAAQAPDAFAPAGDPCCGTPATWLEVAEAATLALVAVVAFSLVLVAAVSLLSWAARRRWPHPRVPFAVPAVAVGALAVVLALTWIVDEPRLRADCGTFAVGADGRTPDVRTAEGLARCRVLQGARSEQVRRRLGRPARTRRWRGRTEWVYVSDGTTFVVGLRRGRVTSASFFSEIEG